MRRGRTLIFVLLIIIIGLVVGYVAIRQFLVAPAPTETQSSTVEVYVAGQNIPQGGKISEELLTTITIPQDKVVAVMFTQDELGALAGRAVVCCRFGESVAPGCDRGAGATATGSHRGRHTSYQHGWAQDSVCDTHT